MLPGASFGDKQALAEHRAQHADSSRGSRVILVVVHQYMTDRIGRVEDKAGSAKEAALDDILFICALAPSADRALSHCRHPSERAHVVGGARRTWRHKRLAPGGHVPGFGYAHGQSFAARGAVDLSGTSCRTPECSPGGCGFQTANR